MKAMNATGDTYELSVLYVRVRSFEMLPLFMFYAFQATRQSTGDTLTPVIFNVFSVIPFIAVISSEIVDCFSSGRYF